MLWLPMFVLLLQGLLPLRSSFAGHPHNIYPQRGGRVELAYMVGLARACSVMHANASSGRPQARKKHPYQLPHNLVPLV